jgi:hypothetical protein
MFRKTESMTIKEFMERQYTKKVKKLPSELSMIPLAIMPVLSATPAFAETHRVTDAMYDKMLHAFDPLITLVQALAYPVAMVVVLGGALFVMIGNKEKGFTMMQGAGLGYVLVQMTPLVLNILVEAMKGI